MSNIIVPSVLALTIITSVVADYRSGEGESWPTSEDEYITDNKGERSLLEKLDLVNTHVSNLIYAFNGTTMFINDLKTLANMAEEMKNINNEITELKYSDYDMKIKFRMTDADIEKAKKIYFDTINKMVQLSEILQSFRTV
uniref:Uncharacterized protein n=1 Tax=Homalodisca liturata TaxID=320908 RepID=A0A1B6J355_9HEMI